MDEEAKRKLHRAVCQSWANEFAKSSALDDWELLTNIRPYPDVLKGLTCGAKTRAGTPCKQLGLYLSGRCKLHGGQSTGPRSEEGKAKTALNGHMPKAHLSKSPTALGKRDAGNAFLIGDASKVRP